MKKRFWRTFGATSASLRWHLGVVTQPIDVIRDCLPNAELLVLEGIDETEQGILLGVRSKKSP
jgi:hypothetical protein